MKRWCCEGGRLVWCVSTSVYLIYRVAVQVMKELYDIDVQADEFIPFMVRLL